jgi:hypothetical protein
VFLSRLVFRQLTDAAWGEQLDERAPLLVIDAQGDQFCELVHHHNPDSQALPIENA